MPTDNPLTLAEALSDKPPETWIGCLVTVACEGTGGRTAYNGKLIDVDEDFLQVKRDHEIVRIKRTHVTSCKPRLLPEKK